MLVNHLTKKTMFHAFNQHTLRNHTELLVRIADDIASDFDHMVV